MSRIEEEQLDDWKERELETTWDEKPEGIPIGRAEYAEPTERTGDLEDDAEPGEELEEDTEPLGEAFEKDTLGHYRRASSA